MKKIIVICSLAIFSILIFKYFKHIKNESFKIIHKYSTRLSQHTAAKTYSFDANDYVIRLEEIKLQSVIAKAAGVLQEPTNHFQAFEQQSGILEILTEHKIDLEGRDVLKTIIKSGGMKRVFKFKNNLIGLFTFKSNDSGCYYASLINLTRSVEFMRGSCLPDVEQIDFNGIGGGYAELNDKLLVAIGTPTAYSDEISDLAQNLNSYYGKILQFTLNDVLTPYKKFNKSHIFSVGHRNPQGLINVGGTIFSVEHGPKGGDEINLIKLGGNYGWPLYSFGSKYDGKSAYYANVGINGFVTPLYTFIPSIGISNISNCPQILVSRYTPAKCLLVSSLRARSIYVLLLNPVNLSVLSAEQINVGMRVREFYQNDLTKDIFVITDHDGFYKIHFESMSKFFR